jgi:hypothetical protein
MNKLYDKAIAYAGYFYFYFIFCKFVCICFLYKRFEFLSKENKTKNRVLFMAAATFQRKNFKNTYTIGWKYYYLLVLLKCFIFDRFKKP